MKNIIIFILSLFSTTLYAMPQDINQSEYSYEATVIECHFNGVIMIGYTSSDDSIDLTGKNCPQAISYIKSVSAYPVEFTKVSVWSVSQNDFSRSLYLVEHLKKK